MINKDNFIKSKNVLNVNLVVLIPISIITIIIILIYILINIFNIFNLTELEKIANSISGFSSLLAFLWLIATVILQSTSIKIQHEEMIKASNSNSIQISIQAKIYIRSRLQEIANIIFLKNKATRILCLEMAKKYGEVVYAYEAYDNPGKFIVDIVFYFLDQNFNVSEIDPNKGLIGVIESLDDEDIRSDFKYEALNDLDILLLNIDETWGVCKQVFNDAEELGLSKETEIWINELNITWYRDNYMILNALDKKITKYVATHGGYSHIQSFMAKLDFSKEDEVKSIEIPFMTKVKAD